MVLDTSLPVLIVGAGPVGLLTALTLHMRGVSVQLIERRLDRSCASRASTFQPPVLDLLDVLGLLNELEPLGQRVDRIASWNLDCDECQEVSLAILSGLTNHPYRLHLEQKYLVSVLERLLEALAPGCLFRGIEVIACDQAGLMANTTTAMVHGRDVNGNLRSFVGSWVVAADGAHSRLRQSAALPFLGHDEVAPVVRLFLPSVPYLLAQKLAPVTYVRRGDRSLSFLQMLNGWRVILRPFPEEVDSALACPPMDLEAQLPPASQWSKALLRQVLDDEISHELWMDEGVLQDHYLIRQRMVEKNLIGRLLLIGDAAHVTNTRGGLNMNFGLLEGYALADALSRWWDNTHDQNDCIDVDPNGGTYVRAWSERWQERIANVLMPRTACMRGVGTLFDLISTSSSVGNDENLFKLKETMISATLLDMVQTDELIDD